MNKIYKVIFNRNKNRYEIVSELASSRGGKCKVKVGKQIAKLFMTGLLATSLSSVALAADEEVKVKYDAATGTIKIVKTDPNTNVETIVATYAVGGNISPITSIGDKDSTDTKNPTGIIAMGDQSKAVQSNSIAIGADAHAGDLTPKKGTNYPVDNSNGYIAIGTKTVASGDRSIALGNQSTSNNGSYNIAQGNDSIGIGTSTSVFGYSGVSIGRRNIIGIPDPTLVSKDGVLTTKSRTKYSEGDLGGNSVIVGAYNVAYGNRSNVIGTYSRAMGSNSVAIGSGVQSLSDGSIAIGKGSGYEFQEGSRKGGRREKEFYGRDWELPPEYKVLKQVLSTDIAGDKQYEKETGTWENGGTLPKYNNYGAGSSDPGGFIVEGKNALGIGTYTQVRGDSAIGLATGEMTADLSKKDKSQYARDMRKIMDMEETLYDAKEALQAGTGDTETLKSAVKAAEERLEAAKKDFRETYLKKYSFVDGDGALGVGRQILAQGDRSMAVGDYAKAISNDAIAYGGQTLANGTNSMAMGGKAHVGTETDAFANSMAIGSHTNVQAGNAVALGAFSEVTGQNSLALGFGKQSGDAITYNSVSGKDSTLIGSYGTVKGNNSILIGSNGNIANDRVVGLGNNINIKAADQNDQENNTAGSVFLGDHAGYVKDSKRSRSLGQVDVVGSAGKMELTESLSSTKGALRDYTKDFIYIYMLERQDDGPQIGAPIAVRSDFAGGDSTVGVVSVGSTYEQQFNSLKDIQDYHSKVGSLITVPVDVTVQVTKNGVPLGEQQQTRYFAADSTRDTIYADKTLLSDEDREKVWNAIQEKRDTPNSTYTVFETRRIQNVAPGLIGVNSTDAINGSQLFATNQMLGNLVGSLKKALGDNVTITEDGQIKVSGGTLGWIAKAKAADGGTVDYQVGKDDKITKDNLKEKGSAIEAADQLVFQAGKNIGLVQTPDTLTISTIDTPSFKSVELRGDEKTVDGKKVTEVTKIDSSGMKVVTETSTPASDGGTTVTEKVSTTVGKDGVSTDGSVKVTNGKDGDQAKDLVTIGKNVDPNAPAGTDGENGTIGLDGKNGSSATITVDRGTSSLDNTKNIGGTDPKQDISKDNPAKMDRITYTTKDKEGNDVITHEVATMDDGLFFQGDVSSATGTNNTFSRKLSEKVSIVGEVKDGLEKEDATAEEKAEAIRAKLSDGNIGVISDGTDTLTVKLAKQLTGLDSTTYTSPTTKTDDGNATSTMKVDGNGVRFVGDNNAVKTDAPSLTTDGITGGNKTITDVASGIGGEVKDSSHNNANTFLENVNKIGKKDGDQPAADAISENVVVNAKDLKNLVDTGFKLNTSGQGTAGASTVKIGDTINIIDGANTKVSAIDDSTTGTHTFHIDVNGLPMSYVDSDGNPLTKIGDKFYKTSDLVNGVPPAGTAEVPANKVTSNVSMLDNTGSHTGVAPQIKNVGSGLVDNKGETIKPNELLNMTDANNPVLKNAVNVGDLKQVAAAAKTEVTGTGEAFVTDTEEEDGHIIYNVHVDKILSHKDAAGNELVRGGDGKYYTNEAIKDKTYIPSENKWYSNSDLTNGKPNKDAQAVTPNPVDQSNVKTSLVNPNTGVGTGTDTSMTLDNVKSGIGGDAGNGIKEGTTVDGTQGNNTFIKNLDKVGGTGKGAIDKTTVVNAGDLKNLADTPLFFSGDAADGKEYNGATNTKNTFGRKLSEEAKIVGGVTTPANLTDNNIGVVSNGSDTLTIKLAKQLTGLDSATYTSPTTKTDDGDATSTMKVDGNGIRFVGDNNVVKTDAPSLTTDGITGGNKQITNVGSGLKDGDTTISISDLEDSEKWPNTNPIWNNAVNVGDLKKAKDAATTEVTGTGKAIVTKTVGNKGQNIYNVHVDPVVDVVATDGKTPVVRGDDGKYYNQKDIENKTYIPNEDGNGGNWYNKSDIGPNGKPNTDAPVQKIKPVDVKNNFVNPNGTGSIVLDNVKSGIGGEVKDPAHNNENTFIENINKVGKKSDDGTEAPDAISENTVVNAKDLKNVVDTGFKLNTSGHSGDAQTVKIGETIKVVDGANTKVSDITSKDGVHEFHIDVTGLPVTYTATEGENGQPVDVSKVGNTYQLADGTKLVNYGDKFYKPNQIVNGQPVGDAQGFTINDDIRLVNPNNGTGPVKITNVAPGVGDTDAVNMSQLKTSSAGSKTEVTGTGAAEVTKKTAKDGHDIYNVHVDKLLTVKPVTPGTAMERGADGKYYAPSEIQDKTFVSDGNGGGSWYAKDDVDKYGTPLNGKSPLAQQPTALDPNTLKTSVTNPNGNGPTIVDNVKSILDSSSIGNGANTSSKIDAIENGKRVDTAGSNQFIKDLTGLNPTTDANKLNSVSTVSDLQKVALTPLFFEGDTAESATTNNAFGRKLSEKAKIVGGQKDVTKLTDNNIGVVSNGSDTLTVKLAKELQGLTSLTTIDKTDGTKTIVSGKGVTTNGKVVVNNGKTGDEAKELVTIDKGTDGSGTDKEYGKIGLDGKNGSNATITIDRGTKSLNDDVNIGVNPSQPVSETNESAKMDRITYTTTGPKNTVINHEVATLDDGFFLTTSKDVTDNKAAAKVKLNNTIKFTDGANTKVSTVTSKDGVHELHVDVSGLPMTYVDKDGNPLVKVGDKFYQANDVVNGVPKDNAKPVADENVTSNVTMLDKDGKTVNAPQIRNVGSSLVKDNGERISMKDLNDDTAYPDTNPIWNSAVNVKDLKSAVDAATTEVTGTGAAEVTKVTGANGQNIYNVHVDKLMTVKPVDPKANITRGGDGKYYNKDDIAGKTFVSDGNGGGSWYNASDVDAKTGKPLEGKSALDKQPIALDQSKLKNSVVNPNGDGATIVDNVKSGIGGEAGNGIQNGTTIDGTTGNNTFIKNLDKVGKPASEGGIDKTTVVNAGDLKNLADTPLFFQGDVSSATGTNNTFSRKLSEKVSIVGEVKHGLADTASAEDKANAIRAKLSDGNIGVVSNGTDTLTIKLAKNLVNLTSVETGSGDNKTKMTENGVTTTVKDGDTFKVTTTTPNGLATTEVKLDSEGMPKGESTTTMVTTDGVTITTQTPKNGDKPASTTETKLSKDGLATDGTIKVTGDNAKDLVTIAKGTETDQNATDKEFGTVAIDGKNGSNAILTVDRGTKSVTDSANVGKDPTKPIDEDNPVAGMDRLTYTTTGVGGKTIEHQVATLDDGFFLTTEHTKADKTRTVLFNHTIKVLDGANTKVSAMGGEDGTHTFSIDVTGLPVSYTVQQDGNTTPENVSKVGDTYQLANGTKLVKVGDKFYKPDQLVDPTAKNPTVKQGEENKDWKLTNNVSLVNPNGGKDAPTLSNVGSALKKSDGTRITMSDLDDSSVYPTNNPIWNNAVNVGDLKAATDAARTEVTGTGKAIVTKKTGDKGQNIYNVHVDPIVDVVGADGSKVVRGDDGKYYNPTDIANKTYIPNADGNGGNWYDNGDLTNGVPNQGAKPQNVTPTDVKNNFVNPNGTGSIVLDNVKSGIGGEVKDAAGKNTFIDNINKVGKKNPDGTVAPDAISENTVVNAKDLKNVVDTGFKLNTSGHSGNAQTVKIGETIKVVDGANTRVSDITSKDGVHEFHIDVTGLPMTYTVSQTGGTDAPVSVSKVGDTYQLADGTKLVKVGDKFYKPSQLVDPKADQPQVKPEEVAKDWTVNDSISLVNKDGSNNAPTTLKNVGSGLKDANGNSTTLDQAVGSNAVNVDDLRTLGKAATTEVTGTGAAEVTKVTGADGQNIYNVHVERFMQVAETDVEGNKVVKAADNYYYKEADIKDKTYIDGQWYNNTDIKDKTKIGDKWYSNTEITDGKANPGAKELTVQATTAPNKAVGLQNNLVNPNDNTPTRLSNLASALSGEVGNGANTEDNSAINGIDKNGKPTSESGSNTFVKNVLDLDATVKTEEQLKTSLRHDPSEDEVKAEKARAEKDKALLNSAVTVADLQKTLQSPLFFEGDSADGVANENGSDKNTFARKLSQKTKIVGGVDLGLKENATADERQKAIADKLTDGNIGVISDGTNTLTIKLAKNLVNLTSVETGSGNNKTKMTENGITTTVKDGDTFKVTTTTPNGLATTEVKLDSDDKPTGESTTTMVTTDGVTITTQTPKNGDKPASTTETKLSKDGLATDGTVKVTNGKTGDDAKDLVTIGKGTETDQNATDKEFGTVTIDGKNGSNATLTVDRGTSSLDDTKNIGTDPNQDISENNPAKMDRITYTTKNKDGKDVTHEVATLDDGFFLTTSTDVAKGKAAAGVKLNHTIKFTDGANTKVSTVDSKDGIHELHVDVTGLPMTYTVSQTGGTDAPVSVSKVGDTYQLADGTKLVKVNNKFYKPSQLVNPNAEQLEVQPEEVAKDWTVNDSISLVNKDGSNNAPTLKNVGSGLKDAAGNPTSIDKAVGSNAVNVDDLRTMGKAATTEVTGTGAAEVTKLTADDGHEIYNVHVDKLMKVTAVTPNTDVTRGGDGKYYKAGDIADKTFVSDGNGGGDWYNSTDVDEKTGKPLDGKNPLPSDQTPQPMKQSDLKNSIVNPNGDGPTVVDNVKSVLDSASIGNGGADGSTIDGVGGNNEFIKQLTGLNPATAADKAKLNSVATVGDLQKVALTPLFFEGDSADGVPATDGTDKNTFGRKLSEKAKIVGGVDLGLQGTVTTEQRKQAIADKLTDKNIGVISNGSDTLTIKLAKDLTGLNSSVYTSLTPAGNDGDATSSMKLDGNGIRFIDGQGKAKTDAPSLTTDGIKGGNKQITNIGSGLRDRQGNPVTLKNASRDILNNAVNVKDLRDVVQGLTDSSKGGGFGLTGNNGEVRKSLGETITLKGGIANKIENGIDMNKPEKATTDKNTYIDVKTSKNGSEKIMVVEIAKDLTDLNSAEFTDQEGNTTKMKGDGIYIDKNGDGNADISLTSEGLNNGGNKITNVADGTEDTDAVNVSQLNKLKQEIKQNIGDEINELNAYAPVVYSDKEGNRVIRKGNKFVKKNDETVEILPQDIRLSLVNADGKTTTPSTLQNVAKGVKDTDAVNVKQLTDATEKPLTFNGDAGSSSAKLGETVAIKGGANSADLTDNNIGVIANSSTKTLNVKLSKKLKGLESAEFVDNNGNTTNITGDGVHISGGNGSNVSLTSQGLNNGGNRITNVAPGVEATDAVNVSQLNQVGAALHNRINNVAKGAYGGVASAGAMASLPQAYLPGKSMVAAGASHYRGESAVALGASRISDNGKIILKLNASHNTSGNTMVGAGVGYQF